MSDQHIEAAAKAIFRDVTGYDLERHDGSDLDEAVWQDAQRHGGLAVRTWLDSVGFTPWVAESLAYEATWDAETHRVAEALCKAVRAVQHG